jgi:hypothetical protein
MRKSRLKPVSGGSLPIESAVSNLPDRCTRPVIEFLRNLTHVVICFGVFRSFLEDLFFRFSTGDKIAIDSDIPAAQSFFHDEHLL